MFKPVGGSVLPCRGQVAPQCALIAVSDESSELSTCLELTGGTCQERIDAEEDAVTAARAHAKTMLEDLEHWQPVAVNTRVDGAGVTTKPLGAS